MKISDCIRLYQAYLNSLDDGGDKVGDMLSRIYNYKGAPTIVENMNKLTISYYGFKRFVDGAKFLTKNAKSFDGCTRNDASGLKCTDYFSAYSQTVNEDEFCNAKKIMTIGISDDAKISSLTQLHTIKTLYESGADFGDSLDPYVLEQEREIIERFIHFTKNITETEKRNGFRKEILCKPSNLAKILGYDVIQINEELTDIYPEFIDVNYVILNRSKACVLDSEAQLFQDEYQKIISAKQTPEK